MLTLPRSKVESDIIQFFLGVSVLIEEGTILHEFCIDINGSWSHSSHTCANQLKGQCHASLVKLQKTKRRLSINEDQKNAVVLFSITIEVHWTHYLLFVAKNGKDGNGLKLEKTGQLFSSLETMPSESGQKLNTNSSLCRKLYISYLLSGLSGML